MYKLFEANFEKARMKLLRISVLTMPYLRKVLPFHAQKGRFETTVFPPTTSVRK